ncbi:coiled-coil-helix-coiled-coil-helix domain-containing protein 2-like [Pelmatolapia mariae]|uniref:coiled-coil-helix-coiled-coil-helix domain-containing protein 2-like n=1 Tax=Pelmatolapia mariae TaxID=158779 RepID=UPI003211E278
MFDFRRYETQAPPSAVGTLAAAPRQPGMFVQMASTAAGVAVGSAVGHTITQAMTGGFSGGHSEPARPDVTYRSSKIWNRFFSTIFLRVRSPLLVEPYQAQPVYQQGAPQQQQQQACSYELRQFVACAQKESDLKLCEGFNEALKKCMSANGE